MQEVVTGRWQMADVRCQMSGRIARGFPICLLPFCLLFFWSPERWPGLATTRSPTHRRAVPWALRGFTAEFGMGSGGPPAL
jgi:hypothetical protein